MANLAIDQYIFFVILIVAFYLLFTEKLKNDIVALLIILSLALTKLLTPKEALSGFGSEPAIIAASVFVLSEALQHTGISELIGYGIGKLVGRGQMRVVFLLMLCVAGLAAFTHHVTITAMMLPITLNIARERKIAGSKLLMPLSFAASLGTTMTVISAPAFLVASATLVQAGRPALGIFSITPVGIALVLTGALFMLLAGRYLLPNHETSVEATESTSVKNYLTELVIQNNSSLVGKSLAQIKEDNRYHFTVINWTRNKQPLAQPFLEEIIQPGDVLHVHTTPSDLIAFRNERGIDFHPVQRFGEKRKSGNPIKMAQAVVASNAEFIGQNLREIDFRRRFGAVVIGFWRQGEFLQEELSLISLKAGDVLVIQGAEDDLTRVEQANGFSMLLPHHEDEREHEKGWLVALIVLGGILLAAFRLVEPEIAMLTAAVAIVLSNSLTLKQAYRAIDIRIYIFIAGAIPLGLAMQNTGVADLLAQWLKAAVGSWNPMLLLFILYMLVGLITQLMSDAATVALFAPVAAALALSLGHNPEAYVITTAMGSVTACLTPTGHHGNLLVYGPGGYKFSDFVRVGLPLTILQGIVVAVLTPLLWKL